MEKRADWGTVMGDRAMGGPSFHDNMEYHVRKIFNTTASVSREKKTVT